MVIHRQGLAMTFRPTKGALAHQDAFAPVDQLVHAVVALAVRDLPLVHLHVRHGHRCAKGAGGCGFGNGKLGAWHAASTRRGTAVKGMVTMPSEYITFGGGNEGQGFVGLFIRNFARYAQSCWNHNMSCPVLEFVQD